MSRYARLAVTALCAWALVAVPTFADGSLLPKPSQIVATGLKIEGAGEKKSRARQDEPGTKKPKPKKKADASERILDALALEFVLQENTNINDIPLFELLIVVSKKCEVPVRIYEDGFRTEGQPNIREEKPKVVATSLRDLSLHQFLTATLESLNATYLVKNGAIEIVPIRYAAEVSRSATTAPDENGHKRLKDPLVSVIAKEKPLNEVVAKLAETYDLNVTLLPQAADARTGFVTVRLLNLPADKALELLALQCDLRVARRGTAFLVTSKDHANELFSEQIDQQRQKIELEKLRTAPPAPPVPPVPPAPVPPAPKM